MDNMPPTLSRDLEVLEPSASLLGYDHAKLLLNNDSLSRVLTRSIGTI